MKYYDTYLPYFIDNDYDQSYPAPEMQLLWRLDCLQDRLEELIAKDAPYRNEYITQRMTLDTLCPDTFLTSLKLNERLSSQKMI